MGKREYEALIIIGVIILSLVIGEMVLMPLLGSTVYQFILKPAFGCCCPIIYGKAQGQALRESWKLFRFIMLWSTSRYCVRFSLFRRRIYRRNRDQSIRQKHKGDAYEYISLAAYWS